MVVKDIINIKIVPDRKWFYLHTTHVLLLLLRHYPDVLFDVGLNISVNLSQMCQGLNVGKKVPILYTARNMIYCILHFHLTKLRLLPLCLQIVCSLR